MESLIICEQNEAVYSWYVTPSLNRDCAYASKICVDAAKQLALANSQGFGCKEHF